MLNKSNLSMQNCNGHTAIRDRLGLLHPVAEIHKALKSLNRQREKIIAQNNVGYTELLKGIDVAIAAHKELLQQVEMGE